MIWSLVIIGVQIQTTATFVPGHKVLSSYPSFEACAEEWADKNSKETTKTKMVFTCEPGK